MDNTIYIVMVDMPYMYASTEEEAKQKPRTIKPYGVFTESRDAYEAKRKAEKELKDFALFHEYYAFRSEEENLLSWTVKVVERPLNEPSHISAPHDIIHGAGFWLTEKWYKKNLDEEVKFREQKKKEKNTKQKQKKKLKENGIVHIKEIDTYSVTFDNGLHLEAYHSSDCCESHWIEFDTLANYNVGSATGKDINIYEQEFDFSNGVQFEKVDGLGIMLIDTQGNKYLVNGYGTNNGYYSTNLELQLVYYDELYDNGLPIFTYDVTQCQAIEWT